MRTQLCMQGMAGTMYAQGAGLTSLCVLKSYNLIYWPVNSKAMR